MNANIKFSNVSFDYIKITNTSSGIKESLLGFIKNFGQDSYKQEQFHVLQGVTFEIEHGDRVCIIGKNGAGKSTMLRLITGIYQPKHGQILTQGRISSLIEIGAGMDPELTGRENIYISGLISGYFKKQLAAKEKEIINFADIGDFIDVPVKYYSTGMGARLSFSIATTIDPEILIVDELFAGGDINFINKATKRIEDIKSDASIFIAVSHDMNYVKEFFNKIIYINNNKVEYFGEDIDFIIKKYFQDNA